jgi:hypothetical protein
MKLFQNRNSVWNIWVDLENPLLRVCVRPDLGHPDKLAEIMVAAARCESAWGRVESVRRRSFAFRRGHFVCCWCIAQRTGQTQKPAPPKSRW